MSLNSFLSTELENEVDFLLKDKEVSHDKVILHDKLGEGEFGVVYKGVVHGIIRNNEEVICAVKMPKVDRKHWIVATCGSRVGYMFATTRGRRNLAEEDPIYCIEETKQVFIAYEIAKGMVSSAKLTRTEILPNFYELMLSCWQEDPNERPTFHVVREQLDAMLGNRSNYFEFEQEDESFKEKGEKEYLRRASYISNTYIQNFKLNALKEQVEQEIEVMQNSLQQLKVAQSKFIESKECMDKFTPENEASLYVPGQLKDVNNVLIDIGTGYYAEKTLPEAKKYFQRKVDFVTKQMERVQPLLIEKSKMRQVITEVMSIKIQSQMSQQQAGGSKS
ncbi:Prefoldin subunit 5 [Holothuria leucospilota]|uniref:Prefoldin subunit 5 n=1 Tax=Holothuria leucospilota TaxID=206669 RepID=A0A9Q1C3M2_HOLLE|nr:Prefoldin subunit 5 [Holothuria leucospilota]